MCVEDKCLFKRSMSKVLKSDVLRCFPNPVALRNFQPLAGSNFSIYILKCRRCAFLHTLLQ